MDLVVKLYGKQPESKPASENRDPSIGQNTRTGQPPFSRGIKIPRPLSLAHPPSFFSNNP